MSKTLKRRRLSALALALSLLLVTASALLIFAEESIETVNGIYEFSPKNIDSVKIGSKVFEPVGSDGIKYTFILTLSGVDNKYNELFLNGKSLGYLVNGENEFSLDLLELKESGNELRVLLSMDGGVHIEGKAYGTYNLDDIVCEKAIIKIGNTEYSPGGAVLYMPTASSAVITEKAAKYSDSLAIGDGWVASTGLGGSTPEVPVSVGYTFDKQSSDAILFAIDTTEFADGLYEIEYVKDGSVSDTKSIIIDNSAPALVLSFTNGDTLPNTETISINLTDVSDFTYSIFCDGKKISKTDIPLSSYDEGSHTLAVSAVDALGNELFEFYEFKVVLALPFYDWDTSGSSTTFITGEDVTATMFSASLLGKINMYTNSFGEFGMDYLRSSDEVLVSFKDKANITTKPVGNTLPYQSFVIETGETSGEVVISYEGQTGNGTDIVLSGWNHKTQAWDDIAKVPSGVSSSVRFTVDDYSKDGKMRIKAMPYVFSNGSNTLLWLTDTQYYSRYDDLNKFYYDIVNYAKDEYIDGNINYVVHTGDIIDQTADSTEARREYAVASAAQEVLDSAGIPNGVVVGNHDITHTNSDYTYYWEYFGADRYKDTEWFGGELNNNMHHFDLITIGRYDFIFLYLGCYEETSADTIAWANAVLEAYPDRNAVICTHEYLLPSGEYSGDRAEVIWEEIIVPNDNVMMVLCGHNQGAAMRTHKVEGSGRYVVEILSDYQFSELGQGPQHVENGMTCDGEGFLRLLTFTDAGQLINTTYSPSYDKYNYFPSYLDEFVVDLDLMPADRSITTKSFYVGTDVKKLGLSSDSINYDKHDAVFAEFEAESSLFLTGMKIFKDRTVDYVTYNPNPIYEENFERYPSLSPRGISPYLSFGITGTVPTSKQVRVGKDLLPASDNKVTKTSGVDSYESKYFDDGSFSLVFTDVSSGWVSASLSINETIDFSEYNRLYFSVTASELAKWNISLNFAGSSPVNFSQNLYELFGYSEFMGIAYEVPSDISGTWSGYIDLTDIASGDKKLNTVTFSAATPDEEIIFDYLFLGHSEGETITFVYDDDYAESVELYDGQTLSAPSVYPGLNKTLLGWSTSKNGDAVNISTIKKTTTLYALLTDSKQAGGREIQRLNDEVDIAYDVQYNYFLLITIIGLTAFAICVAITVTVFRKRKKGKN